MANVLKRAGYGTIKILDAISFPKCEMITLDDICSDPPPEEIDFKLFGEDGKAQIFTLKEIGQQEILDHPVYSILSHLDFTPSLVLQFSFGEILSQKLRGSHAMQIPMPAEWPTPYFMEIEESPVTA